MRRIASCAVFILAAALSPDAQQNPFTGPGPAPQAGAPQPGVPPQNRAAPPATGTARIRGRVVHADTGAPLRGAEVTLSGDLLRRADTDDSGRYEFANLPAGRFFLSATKGGYATPSSSPTSFDPGRSFTLVDSQVLNRDLTLPRGSVIRGRITDEFGDPVTGAEIRIERYQYGPGGRQLATFTFGVALSPLSLATNDLGEFRVFGLMPGEYVVSARIRSFGATLTTGPAGARDAAEGFLPTYYPGTISTADAQMVRVGVSQEVAVDFPMVPGRMVRVSGTATNSSGRPATGLNVFLGVETATSSGQINGGGVAADGSFSIGNVPPGNYVLRVQQQGGGAPGTETASMPISVATEDIAGLHLTTRPGATIRGHVEWEGTAPRPTTSVQIVTRSADWGPGPFGGESTITYLDPENGTVRDDDTFELGGIKGKVLFNANVLTQAWSVKTVMVGRKDITDAGVDAASLGGDARIVVVLTDKVASLSGSVRDGRGQTVKDYVLVLLPQQPMTGMGATRFTRFVRPDEAGTFGIRVLPPGQYVAAAVEGLDQGREWDPAFQKIVRTTGQRFTLDEGQSLALNLDLLQ